MRILRLGIGILLSLPVLSFVQSQTIPHYKFKFVEHRSLKIPEPSDIVYDSTTMHFFIVSDHGILLECDTIGNVIRKADKKGMDFEGVEVRGDDVYVSDETPREVYKYDRKTLKLEATYSVPLGGKLNKGFESITYNSTKNCFVLVSEKPAVIYEFDENFKVLGQYSFNDARDISSARWHQGKMYLLSDEDACIFKCDPRTYQPLEKYSVSILNPEGLCFDSHNNVYITSDDLERLYFFKNLPTQP